MFREMAEADPERWHFWSPVGWGAQFSAGQKAVLEKGMNPLAARRFLENEWLEEGEDAFLTAAQVDRCLREYDPRDIAQGTPFRGMGIDLGLTRDASSIAVVGGNAEANYALLALDVFVGSREEPVDLRAVGETALLRAKEWGPLDCVLDPWQGMHMHQQIGGALRSEVFHFGAASMKELTEITWQVMSQGKFRFWPGAGKRLQRGEPWDLERELRGAILKVMPYGERLDHQSSGYTDRLISVALAIWKLSQRSLMPPVSISSEGGSPSRESSWKRGLIRGMRPHISRFDRMDEDEVRIRRAHRAAREAVDRVNRGGY
jgi:hypothetical protein